MIAYPLCNRRMCMSCADPLWPVLQSTGPYSFTLLEVSLSPFVLAIVRIGKLHVLRVV